MANTRLKSAAEKTSNTNVNGQSLVPLDFVRELLKVQEDTIKVFFSLLSLRNVAASYSFQKMIISKSIYCLQKNS